MNSPEMTLAAYRQGYDDATAKLRAENDKLKGWLETETMNREEFKKLREENAELRRLLEHFGYNSKYVRDYLATLSPPSEA